MKRQIGIVLKGYPRLSETFIAQEIHGLEERGAKATIFSLRHPADRARHPIHDRIRAAVFYLPEYLHEEPVRVLRAALWALTRRTFPKVLLLWLGDLMRDPSRNRVRRFGQALVLAREAPKTIDHFHAHFLHTPSSVTRYGALLTRRSWSVSAHAVDIWTTPDWEKRGKLRSARFAVTCTAAGRDHLNTLVHDRPDPVHLVYHGLDWRDVPPAPVRPLGPDGTDLQRPVRLLTVARAVEKKGLDLLIRALAALPPYRAWHWTLIGGGPLIPNLKDQAWGMQISSRITWAGALPREAVFNALQDTDLFVLPSRIAADGNRDGLPNVLMEAMSQAVACLSSDVSSIPELITHGRTGWLVPPGDETALHHALDRLITDPGLRADIADEGHDHVRARFGATEGLDRIAALLDLRRD